MELIDYTQQTIAGILVIPFIMGWVQFIKEVFNLDGSKVTAITVLIGALMFAGQQVSLLNIVFAQYFEIVIYALGGGLASSGLYKLARSLSTNE